MAPVPYPGAGEDARHAAVADAFALRALLGSIQIGFHFRLLRFGGDLGNQFAFGSQHHESNAKHRIGASRKDDKLKAAVFDMEFHFRAFRAAYPVALCFLQRIRPLDSVQPVQQTLCVGRHAQAPLAHLLLHHGVAAAFAHAVHHLVVGQHRAQLRTPVHHRLAQVGNAVVHQDFLLFLLALRLPFVGREAKFFGASGL